MLGSRIEARRAKQLQAQVCLVKLQSLGLGVEGVGFGVNLNPEP